MRPFPTTNEPNEDHHNPDRLDKPVIYPGIKNQVSKYTKVREKVNKYTSLDDKVALAPAWANNRNMDPFTITPFQAYGKRDDEEDIELIRYLHDEYPNLFKHDYKTVLPFLKQREEEGEALRFQEFVVNAMGADNGYKREKFMKMFPEYEKMRLDTITQMETLLEKLCHMHIYGYETDEDLELLMQINEGKLTWNQEALKVCLGIHEQQILASNKGNYNTVLTGRDQQNLTGIMSGQKGLDFEKMFRVDPDGSLELNVKDPQSNRRTANRVAAERIS